MKPIFLTVFLIVYSFTLAQSQEVRSHVGYPVGDYSIGLTQPSYLDGPVGAFYPLTPFDWWFPWYPYTCFPAAEELPWVQGLTVFPWPGYRQPTDLEEAPEWTPAEREVYDWEGTFRPAQPDPLIRKAINPKPTDPARDIMILSPKPDGEEQPDRRGVDQPAPRRRVPGQDRRSQSPYTFPDRWR